MQLFLLQIFTLHNTSVMPVTKNPYYSISAYLSTFIVFCCIGQNSQTVFHELSEQSLPPHHSFIIIKEVLIFTLYIILIILNIHRTEGMYFLVSPARAG